MWLKRIISKIFKRKFKMRMVSLRLFICTILIMLLFISSSVLHAEDEIISEETVLTDDIYVEEVFARDENPAESNNKHNKKKKVRDEVISLKGNYLLPKTNLESVLENGKGFSAQYSFKDILIPNMSAGICFQFIHFNGKKDYIDSFIFIPVLADLSYSYSLNFAFDIEAHISAGFTYNILNYSETEVDSKTGEYSTHSGFEPLLRAGFLIAYKFSESIIIKTGVFYNVIPESGGRSDYLDISAGVSVPVNFID